LCREIANQIANESRNSGLNAFSTKKTLGSREEEVLRLIAQGHKSKDISCLLHIAPSTVDVHRRNIKRKTGLHKIADLTRYAIQSRLIKSV
jgi:two-component system NarL family response regulator